MDGECERVCVWLVGTERPGKMPNYKTRAHTRGVAARVKSHHLPAAAFTVGNPKNTTYLRNHETKRPQDSDGNGEKPPRVQGCTFEVLQQKIAAPSEQIVRLSRYVH